MERVRARVRAHPAARSDETGVLAGDLFAGVGLSWLSWLSWTKSLRLTYAEPIWRNGNVGLGNERSCVRNSLVPSGFSLRQRNLSALLGGPVRL